MTTLRPLSAALVEKAAVELNERPELIVSSLEALREWLAKCPHISSRTDDQFLVAFLRGCKFSLERTKEKLDMFYTVRSALPHIIRGRDPMDAQTQEFLKNGFQFPLPNPAPDGSRIIIYRPGAYDANIYTVNDSMRVATIIMDTMMFSPSFADEIITVAGQTAIIDLANVTMAHFVQMTPSTVKRLTVLTQDASPLRQKATHYLNAPPGSDVVFNLIKGFLTEKNRQRFFVHKSLESLQQAIPADCLPAEYGGSVGAIPDLLSDLSTKLIANRDYFIQDDKFGVDEKKRPGKAKSAETLFGVDGSFRSLNVD